MRVWLYYRLSRDEDAELNSLTNQRKILADFADSKEYGIVGESFDDNVSGMHFDRDGIEKIYEVADSGSIDAVVVKDLSRLGRHKTQTALFIDYLRSKNVRVLSVTENIDTFNENDDLLVGFKGIINDFYARDMSRKIRTGFRQKQKDGIVLTPPMGYCKDKNTGEIMVVEEAAAIVRQIFAWYTSGYGLKAVAKMLNAQNIKSPAYYQKSLYGKTRTIDRPEISTRYLWANTAVRRVLTNEFYVGTLVCHKEETNKINKTRKTVLPEDQYRHENFVPPLVTKEVFAQVQFLLTDKLERNVRAAAGTPLKRYTGLLKCADCGSTFVAKQRKWADKPVRIEYNCNGYHRYGKEHCTAHRIDESTLDKLVYDEILRMKNTACKNSTALESELRQWMTQKSATAQRVTQLQNKIFMLQNEIEKILMERILDKENRATYDSMVQKRQVEIERLRTQTEELQNLDATLQRRKSEMKQSIDLLDDIVAEGAISSTHLRMLVDMILICETENGLQLEIRLKAEFKSHLDSYDNADNLWERAYVPAVKAVNL